jgi:RNA polymerase sigma-70 factor (ECF subfamily)
VRFIARSYAMRGIDWRMLPIAANGQPAAAAYVRAVDGVYRAHTLQVFAVTGGAITHTVAFQDNSLFEAFNLPLSIAPE